MSDDQTVQPETVPAPGPADAMKPVSRRQKSSVNKSLLAVVVLLMFLCGGGAWLVFNFLEVKSFTEVQTDTIQAQNTITNARLDAIEERINQSQAQLEHLADTLDALQQSRGSNEDWALNEVEYLLIIASHRITLENNPKAALAAMEAAALRLKDMDDAMLQPVREQLGADMERLRDLDQTDISGLARYLADLINRAASLPLARGVIADPTESGAASTAPGAPETSAQWQGLLGSLWQDLKSLVVIKRAGENRRVLLLPDQEYFLYQNLRLELENARLAVLQRDSANLHTSVLLLTGWIGDYFDTEDEAVRNVLETLTRMSGLNLEPDLPDINSSLETLRAYLRQRAAVPPDPGNGEPPA